MPFRSVVASLLLFLPTLASQAQTQPPPAEIVDPVPPPPAAAPVPPPDAPAPAEPPAAPDVDCSARSANSLLFARGKSDVDASNEALLRTLAGRLNKDRRSEVTLVAYADDNGSAGYELALAEKRLDAVVDTLRRLGVARGQIGRQTIRWHEAHDACGEAADGAPRVDLDFSG